MTAEDIYNAITVDDRLLTAGQPTSEQLETLGAECWLLTDDAAAAEARLAVLAERARTKHDFAVVTHLRRRELRLSLAAPAPAEEIT